MDLLRWAWKIDADFRYQVRTDQNHVQNLATPPRRREPDPLEGVPGPAGATCSPLHSYSQGKVFQGLAGSVVRTRWVASTVSYHSPNSSSSKWRQRPRTYAAEKSSHER